MKTILGGYLETAAVRYFDAINNPRRNSTSHEYYLCLNRKTPKVYFDRASTFLIISDVTTFPSIDWGPFQIGESDEEKIDPAKLGAVINPEGNPGGLEWDADSKIFADILLDSDAFSSITNSHIRMIEFGEINFEQKHLSKQEIKKITRAVAHHYICRILLQIRATRDTDSLLVIAEPDLRLIGEMRDFVVRTRIPTPYDIPDLKEKFINTDDDLTIGLINFAPPDALALAAVKTNKTIQQYASKISNLFKVENTIERHRASLIAMREASEKHTAGERADRIFESISWVLKPLHYLPGLDAILSVTEDVRDIVRSWANRRTTDQQWYLIGSKMTDIALREYLTRKGNLL